VVTTRRPWKTKKTSSTDHSGLSQPIHTPPTTENEVDEMLPPVPAIPSVLADAWDAIEADPKFTNTSRELDTVGVSLAPSLFFCDTLILDSR
jgi:hypothetical protein